MVKIDGRRDSLDIFFFFENLICQIYFFSGDLSDFFKDIMTLYSNKFIGIVIMSCG